LPGGTPAQLTHWAAPDTKAACRIAIQAEKGQAAAWLPGRVRWRTGGVVHSQRLHGPPPEQRVLLHFGDVLGTGAPPRPGLEPTRRCCCCAGCARCTPKDDRQRRPEGCRQNSRTARVRDPLGRAGACGLRLTSKGRIPPA
jgi:hypothetical protein